MEKGKKQSWGSFKNLIKETKLPYLQILLCVVAGLGVSQLNLMFPSYTEQIMAGDFSATIIVATILVLFGGAFMDMAYQVICEIVKANISKRFRDSVWKKIIVLPMHFFDENGASELISRETEDTAQLSTFLTDDIAGIISNVYTFIATLIILLSYDWHLVVAELIIVPIIIVVGLVKGHIDFSLNDSLQMKVALLTGGISEILSSVPLIKVFVQEDKAVKESEEKTQDLYRTKMKITWIGSAFSAISTILEVIESLIVILFGIYLIRNGYITVSVWVAFYMYSTNLTGCVDTLMSVWDDLKVAQGAMRRISELCEEEGESNEGIHLDSIQEDIQMKDVSFNFDDKQVLDHISMNIPKGKHTVIVGPSGAGKTTILNLLERFYMPDEGDICEGKTCINQYSLKSWRDNVGYVTQDSWVIEGTVRDNLVYSLDKEISDEELIGKLKEMNLYHLIEELPEGLDTQVGEGGNMLSGGQRQRISLARTLLRDPELVLLDEVTSSLDAMTEQEICESLQILEGKTVVSVAHKLNIAKKADQIIVMNEGKIESIGTHESLMKENGLYHQMYESQFGKEVA